MNTIKIFCNEYFILFSVMRVMNASKMCIQFIDNNGKCFSWSSEYYVQFASIVQRGLTEQDVNTGAVMSMSCLLPFHLMTSGVALSHADRKLPIMSRGPRSDIAQLGIGSLNH